MSKRPDKRRKITTKSGAECIYDGVGIRVSKGVPVSGDELAEQGRRNIYTVLDEAERLASEILIPNITEPDKRKARYYAPVKGHAHTFSLVADPREEVYDAMHVLAVAELVRKHLLEGRPELAALNALNVGVLAERMRLRPIGDFAMCELEAQKDRSAGHKKTPIEVMRRKLREWDEMLKGHAKKTAAMPRLGIKKATYYKYREAVKAAVKKT